MIFESILETVDVVIVVLILLRCSTNFLYFILIFGHLRHLNIFYRLAWLFSAHPVLHSDKSHKLSSTISCSLRYRRTGTFNNWYWLWGFNFFALWFLQSFFVSFTFFIFLIWNIIVVLIIMITYLYLTVVLCLLVELKILNNFYIFILAFMYLFVIKKGFNLDSIPIDFTKLSINSSLSLFLSKFSLAQDLTWIINTGDGL